MPVSVYSRGTKVAQSTPPLAAANVPDFSHQTKAREVRQNCEWA